MSDKVKHLTIVDDEQNNLDTYQDLLGEKYQLKLIQNPLELIGFINSPECKTDLILLDIHMPQMNGFELYGQFRETHPTIPVIFLTGDPSEESLVEGLTLGAEDFIVKPVSLTELMARINSKIKSKQNSKSSDKHIKFGDFTLHIDIQMAQVVDKKIQLTPIEFKIIHLLANSPNKIFSREYISSLLWPNVHVQNQNIDTHLSNLRKKLQPFSKNIKTIKSRGYILRI